MLVTPVHLRTGLPHVALAELYGTARSTISRAISEIRPHPSRSHPHPPRNSMIKPGDRDSPRGPGPSPACLTSRSVDQEHIGRMRVPPAGDQRSGRPCGNHFNRGRRDGIRHSTAIYPPLPPRRTSPP
ncbi:hypothetical protein [Streptomyces sp. NBC_00342]|uniref:hypothetical protein n=1 Tax=Streptomyces sp. NBC_00342 TaxID=2975718 RepID=UPI003FA7665F